MRKVIRGHSALANDRPRISGHNTSLLHYPQRSALQLLRAKNGMTGVEKDNSIQSIRYSAHKDVK